MIALSVAKLIFLFAGKRNLSLNKAKVESVDQFRRLEVREKVKNVFVMSLRLSDKQVLKGLAKRSKHFNATSCNIVA